MSKRYLVNLRNQYGVSQNKHDYEFNWSSPLYTEMRPLKFAIWPSDWDEDEENHVVFCWGLVPLMNSGMFDKCKLHGRWEGDVTQTQRFSLKVMQILEIYNQFASSMGLVEFLEKMEENDESVRRADQGQTGGDRNGVSPD